MHDKNVKNLSQKIKKETLLSVFIFSFVLLFFFAQPGQAAELTLDDIPRLPGSKLEYSRYESRELLNAEFRIFLAEGLKPYEVAGKGTETAAACVKLMQEKGWQIKKENRQNRGGEFLFKKDIIKEAKLRVAPGSKPMEGKAKKYIFLQFEIKRLIPFEDVTGRDPADVPRFPGSIRVRWMNLLGDFACKFLVVAPLEKVKQFFEKELPKQGWQPSKGAGTLNFIKTGVRQDPKAVVKENLQDPVKMVKKLVPTTLSLRFKENEGIIEIGVGRDAGSGDVGGTAVTPITPAKNLPPVKPGGKPPIIIDIKKDIPIYPGLVELYRKEDISVSSGEEKIKIRFQEKNAPAQEALKMADYYKKKLAGRSWELTNEEWHGIGRKLLFSRPALKVKVEIKAVGRYPIPANARPINIPVEITLIRSIPSREPAGEDIPGVPRFPGSVRFYTLKAGIDHLAKFKAAAGVKAVEWFFIEELPEKGWVFSGTDSTGLLFIPAGTAGSAAEALSKGQLIPTTLKVKVDDQHDGTVKIGTNKTKGDS